MGKDHGTSHGGISDVHASPGEHRESDPSPGVDLDCFNAVRLAAKQYRPTSPGHLMRVAHQGQDL